MNREHTGVVFVTHSYSNIYNICYASCFFQVEVETVTEYISDESEQKQLSPTKIL